jgi:5S rRNA maturation endonuclease (ribonuclease M5)
MTDHGVEGVGEVDAEDLLALLDADNVHPVGQNEVGFSCLYAAGHAGGDRNPSAHINRDSLLWRCKGCGRAGNLLELVKLGLPLGTKHIEAIRWLHQNFGEMIWEPKGGLGADLDARLAKAHYTPPAQRRPNEADTIGPEGIFYLDWRSDQPAAVYMRSRGFAPEVLADWGVGYDQWTERVAMPIRDELGNLVGFKGRALGSQQPKYLLLGDAPQRKLRYGIGYGFNMHDARKVVFGLHRARYAGDVLVLCEGELDAIACHAAGVTHAVALGTTAITDEQLWLLRAHADSVVFFYDSDMAGSGATRTLMARVSPYFRVFVVAEHQGDAASMPPAAVRQLVDGASYWIDAAFRPGALA